MYIQHHTHIGAHAFDMIPLDLEWTKTIEILNFKGIEKYKKSYF